jgi:hypoxanthine phosphoribosyltransferase
MTFYEPINYRIVKKIPRQEIRRQVKRIAQDLTNDYQNQEPVLIGVLNGVFVFFSDLVREMSIPTKIDFVRLASYGSSDVSSGTITLTKDIELPIKGKPVVIIEDIIDTGATLSYLVTHIKRRDPESIKVCALINKLERREEDIGIDYWGFRLKEGFIVGYGLDYNEKFRYLPYLLSIEIKH